MDYFANPDEKNVNDDKIFWKTIKSSLSDKAPSTDN